MTELADVLDRYPELKTEAEIVSLLSLLAISKQGLREILERYRVGSPLEIKERISKGAIPGHPAYEDYLDAVSYTIDVKAAGEAIRKKVDEFLC
jgi:hypothetical protein